ncbi:MAG TPA: hypothetical protein VMH05_01935 [Bryobacteraceae bacterium]|nr:hypothetical protein [Bryobacteraceae bacterium]
MFQTLDERMERNRSRLQLFREALSGAAAVLLAGAGFQAIYSLIFALD